MGVHRVPVLAALAGALLAPAAATADTAALVRPFAGTERGGTFPGATMPFGMVQLSPNTEGALGGGYRHSQHRTWGFAMTHLSGPGCAAMGDVVTQPATGPVSSVDLRSREQTLTSQQATPGAYSTTLAPSGVHAALTATARTGWTRYAFPATWNASVLVQPGANFRGSRNAAAFVVGDRTIEGWVDTWGYWGPCPTRGENRYRVYFSMKFSRPFRAYGTGNGGTLHRRERIARGPDAGAYVLFDTRHDSAPVVAKTGISYVDMAGARRNLAAETGESFDFDRTRQRARAAWNTLLDRILVPRNPAPPAETFYTALYHALLHQSLFSDADGRYVGFDDRIHEVAHGHAHFTAYS